MAPTAHTPVLSAIPPVIPTGCTAPVSESLPAALGRLIASVDPLQVVLFGSYASGEPTPDSDVDLLVVLKTDLPLRERYDLDLLVLTSEELEQRTGSSRLLADIMAHGRVLHEHGVPAPSGQLTNPDGARLSVVSP